MRVEQPARHRRTAGRARRARRRRADLAQHRARVVALPVDRAVLLPHQRPPAPARAAACRSARCAAPAAAMRCSVARHARAPPPRSPRGGRGSTCSRRASRRSRSPRPARASSSPSALQHRHAPLALAFEDRPVERRRTAVADDARMDDRQRRLAPHRFGDRALQERRDDEVRPEQRDRLDRHRVGDVELDRRPRGRAAASSTYSRCVEAVEARASGSRMRIGSPSADARQLLAGEPVDDARPPKRVSHLDEVVRVLDHLADDRGIAAERMRAHRRRAGGRRPPRARSRRACLRWRRRADRGRGTRRPPRPGARPALAASSIVMPTPDWRAISLSVVASPPRVGSRRQRMPGNRVDHRRDEPVQRRGVGDDRRCSNARFSRCDMIAMPWSPIVPRDARSRSPGRARSPEMRDARRARRRRRSS